MGLEDDAVVEKRGRESVTHAALRVSREGSGQVIIIEPLLCD